MKRVLFLANCLHHRKFDDRYLSLVSTMKVDVIGLDWYHGVSDDNPKIHYNEFFTIKKRSSSLSLIERIKYLIIVLIVLILRRISGVRYDLIIANSYDLFIVSSIAFAGNKSLKRIYDIADIHPSLTERGFYSSFLNYLEGLFIKKWTIVVSSPWFYWEYLVKRLTKPLDVYLLENFRTTNNPWPKSNKQKSDKRVILWNGILRCENSAKYLYKLCKYFPEIIELVILGDVSQISKNTFGNLISLNNVTYGGRYDLAILESYMIDVDYIWCADLGQDLNSRLLLPNRLYDCLYYNRPGISIGVNAISSVINHFEIGLVLLAPDYQGLSTFLELTNQTCFIKYQNNLELISKKFRTADEFLKILNGTSKESLSRTVDVGVVFGGINEAN